MRRLIALAVGAVLASTTAVMAQDSYPEKPITILVPFAPGGIVDIAARIVGEGLTQKWGQQVIVENRTGGNGFIAAQAAARAEPDGYTLLAAEPLVSVINELIFETTPYKIAEDFVPITTMTATPLVIAASTQSGLGSMADLIEQSKAKQMNFSSPANGSLNQLVGEWIAVKAGLKLRHIGYRGGAPAAAAVASNEVPFGVLAYSSSRPYVEAGKVKLLAVAEAKRIDLEPELPTLIESGLSDLDATQWTGLYAPAGTPAAIVDKLQKAVVEILASPDAQAKLKANGASPYPSTSAEFTASLAKQRTQFAEIVKAAGLKGR
ncbi:Bug family tripartite tricarboxylate transporter substrate binding protein [Propylenella binzhouense]|uniref:Tripartite tricarboxylate transporter substrate binding protein n=1 Tax=Propylenella binzhouense TaxID=2555902 RepID=A0A964T8K2_9HYPH|nr:tripartite tricarboxylate transporter substrate binding protein [Propylenella binzhouense]MYZ50454.1 tripartite tricarboxylate transporter substrate binding protein [Propylenella binzhouense]